MKRISLTLATILLAGSLFAQESNEGDSLWTITGFTSMNFSQLALSNWAAGGDDNLAGNALFKLSPDYDDGAINWDNDLTLGLGAIKQGDDLARKSDDQIDFSSKLGFKRSKRWFYTALIGFNTQFAKGYDNPGDVDRTKISNFMAPGYLNIALGMDYKPNDDFSLFISPVSTKMTFVMDDDLSAIGAFGVDSSATFRGEFGSNIKLTYKKEILKNVVLDTKLNLFSNYLENPQYVDVNLDLLLTFKVNEYISASLMTQVIYDYDIKFDYDSNGDGTNDASEARVQWKELFGLGLTYSF